MSVTSFIAETESAAVKEAVRSGVPASITEAQAILESGSGRSRLYTQGNNSFGIKCHGDWRGEHIYATDDAPNECFRKYNSVLESFKDHSDFLKKNSRYKFLFDLPPDDYKSWAAGLQKAGYATSKNYANALVNLIEKYDLTRLDRKVKRIKLFRMLLIPFALVVTIIVLILIFNRYKQKQLIFS